MATNSPDTDTVKLKISFEGTEIKLPKVTLTATLPISRVVVEALVTNVIMGVTDAARIVAGSAVSNLQGTASNAVGGIANVTISGARKAGRLILSLMPTPE